MGVRTIANHAEEEVEAFPGGGDGRELFVVADLRVRPVGQCHHGDAPLSTWPQSACGPNDGAVSCLVKMLYILA